MRRKSESDRVKSLSKFKITRKLSENILELFLSATLTKEDSNHKNIS